MSRKYDSIEMLYDKIKGDKLDFMNEQEFSIKLNELVDIGLIEIETMRGLTAYSATPGLEWKDFCYIDDCIKTEILLLLTNNPKTFFVILNTQKGKMRINALEIKEWSEDNTRRVVSFIVVDNDTTLADQSSEGIEHNIGPLNVKVLKLSGTSKDTLDYIKMYIDAYEHNPEYKMPVIVLLANNKQIEKMLKLFIHIETKIKMRNSKLKYGLIFDEADKTYPPFREKNFIIEGKDVCIKDFINKDGLYRLGFTTATDGDLLDEIYPECANAYKYPVVIDPNDEIHYRALHHPEAVIHRIPFNKHTNNTYAMKIIEDNIEYFNTPHILPSGEIYHKKIIINSNSKTTEMTELANWCLKKNMYTIVFNGNNGTSIKLIRSDATIEIIRTKGKKFNELLFYIYKKINLHDKPLVIIGRRKVDRGLGFHYCPRVNDEIIIDGKQGKLFTRNREGLIWTDMILGHIDDKDTASQKAGRIGGIIGNSPQYCGFIHIWTDEETEDLIRRHNTIVDKANTYGGCSILQAMKHAEQTIPKRKINHNVDPSTFLVYTDIEIVRQVCRELNFRFKPNDAKEDGFVYSSLNKKSKPLDLLDAINAVPNGYGYCKKYKDVLIKNGNHTGKYGTVEKTEDGKFIVNVNGEKIELIEEDIQCITIRTYYPCYKDINDSNSIHYVILLIRPNIDLTIVEEIKRKYPPIEVPQEGEF
jgi:hypothetical protein